MLCPSCGKENDGNSKFCSNCGYELANIKTQKLDKGIKEVKLVTSKNLFIFSLIFPLLGSILLIFQVKKLKKQVLPYILFSFSIFLFEFGLIPLITMYNSDYLIGYNVSLIPRMIINLILAVILWKIYKRICINYKNETQIEKVYRISWGIAISAAIISIYTVFQFISAGGTLTTAIYGQSPIVFGLQEDQRDVQDKTKVFAVLDSKIYYAFNFPGGRGGGMIDTILEDRDSGRIIYDSGQVQIPPDWKGIVNCVANPNYVGDFEMKVIKNNEVIARGKFKVR
jgi:hypothetical protein